MQRAERSGQTFGVLMLDIDHFRRYNDTHGHAAGDSVLREMGVYLLQHIGGGDIAGRYGGEEFVVVLSETQLEPVQRHAIQLAENVKNLGLRHNGLSLGQITVSIGIAMFPGNGDSGDALLAAADAALYQAKHAGRNRVITAA